MADPLHTVLVERLGCRWPIIQTAMGWVAEPSLVIGSSNAGAGLSISGEGTSRGFRLSPIASSATSARNTPRGSPKRNSAGAVFSAIRSNPHAADAAVRFPAATLDGISRAPTR